MPEAFAIYAIGHVRCTRAEPIDDNWDAYPSIIELDPERFGAEVLQGLESFSHVEVLYVFDQVRDTEINTSARHPRGRTDWPKIGIFAQRGKGRPNRIGATICRIDSVAGTELRLTGLDAINGTPVIDIKPVMSGFQPRGSFREPDWAVEIMQDYWTASERSD
jgi:tRNA (adenine37-N6)-methyltransferase